MNISHMFETQRTWHLKIVSEELCYGSLLTLGTAIL